MIEAPRGWPFKLFEGIIEPDGPPGDGNGGGGNPL